MTTDRAAIAASFAMILMSCATAGPGPTAWEMEWGDRAFVPFAGEEEDAVLAWARNRLAQGTLSLEDAVALADRFNPDLAAWRGEIDLAATRAWQASLHPNPTAFAEFEDYVYRESAFREVPWTVGISHPLILGGRREAEIRAAQWDRQETAYAYAHQRRELLTRVRQAFVALVAERERVRLAREGVEISRQFHDLAQAQFELDAIPEMPVLKSGVELALAETELMEREAAERSADASLRALIGSPAWASDIVFEGALEEAIGAAPREDAWDQVRARHPAIMAAQARLARAEAELDVERARRLPEVSVIVAGGEDEEGGHIINGGVEVPLPLYDRNQAQIAAAEIRVSQARHGVEASENMLRERFRVALEGLQSAQARAARYRDEVLPQAQTALEQTRIGYDEGEFSYLDVLDAQRTLADVRASHAQILRDLNEAAAEMESLSGRGRE